MHSTRRHRKQNRKMILPIGKKGIAVEKNAFIAAMASLCILFVVVVVALIAKSMNNNPDKKVDITPQNPPEEKEYKTLFETGFMKIGVTISEDNLFLLRETPSVDNYYEINMGIGEELLEKVGIRVKGENNTEDVFENGGTKYSYKLDIDRYSNKNTLFGLEGINIYNMAEDDSYLGQYVAYKYAEHLGAVIPYYSLALVNINEEAAEWYFATEEINDSFIGRVVGNNGTTAGNICLFKADSNDATLDKKDNASNYEVEYGKDGSVSYLNKLIEVLNDEKSTPADIEGILDVDSVLKVFAVNFVVGNYGSNQGQNPDTFYLLYNNGKFTFIQEDYSCAGGNYETDGGLSMSVSKEKPLYRMEEKDRPLVKKLLSIDDYRIRFYNYVQNLYDYQKSNDVLTAGEGILRANSGSVCDTEAYKAAVERLKGYITR